MHALFISACGLFYFHYKMKPAIISLIIALLGLFPLLWMAPGWQPRSLPLVRVRRLVTGLEIAGTVLAAPYQVMRTAVGGRVAGCTSAKGKVCGPARRYSSWPSAGVPLLIWVLPWSPRPGI